MSTIRRPLVALCASVVLIAVQMVLDPTGLLALVGWSGATPEFGRGLWPFAPYVVFLPVMLGMVWWVARRAGDRFWTLAVGNVLAVLLAQAATLLAMTGDLANSAWGAGYVTGKALPAALIIAGLHSLGSAAREQGASRRGAVLVPAIAVRGGRATRRGSMVDGRGVCAGHPGRAARRAGSSPCSIATVMLAALAFPCIRWARSRVPGVLGGWLGAVVAGGALGVIQAVVALDHRRHAKPGHLSRHGGLRWPRGRPLVRRRAWLGSRSWRRGRGSPHGALRGPRRVERA